MLPAVLSLLAGVAAPAAGDIYKWTDERGNLVISNLGPPQPGKAIDVELLAKETPAPPRTRRVETPTEKLLRERIDRLEREAQAQRYASPPPAGWYAGDYPPPPPPDYLGSYYRAPYPAYSYAVYPRRFVIARPFVFHRGGFGRGGTGHRARR